MGIGNRAARTLLYEEVVKDLENKGVKIVEDTKVLTEDGKKDKTVVIRSHGIAKNIYEKLKIKFPFHICFINWQ